jgi:hypothetical protein
VRGTAYENAGGHSLLELYLLVEEDRPLGIRFRRRVTDELEWLARKL